MNQAILKTLSKLKIQNFRCIDVRRRNYSASYNVLPSVQNMLETQEWDKYKSHVSYIVEYLATVEKELPQECNQYIRDLLNYTLPGHVQDTGPLVVSTYKHFAPPEKQTPKHMKLVYTMGWAYDVIARCYEIVDDIFDLSQTRANKRCWHQIKNNSLSAINDSVIMGEAASVLIKNHLLGHPSYIPIVELTNETKFKTALGQMLDLDLKFEHFSIASWKTLAKFKGAQAAAVDPVLRGMYLAELFDKNIHSELKSILLELGEYFMAQNDMLDCYGDQPITGKYGSDILKGRCTWLVVHALADANTSQKELFQKHYGKPDQDSQNMIYNLYKELNILEKFLSYEQKLYQKLNGMIERLPDTIPKQFMYQTVHRCILWKKLKGYHIYCYFIIIVIHNY